MWKKIKNFLAHQMFHLIFSEVFLRYKSISRSDISFCLYLTRVRDFYNKVASCWPRQEVEVLCNRPSISTMKLLELPTFLRGKWNLWKKILNIVKLYEKYQTMRVSCALQDQK